jgi:hypothetical protein
MGFRKILTITMIWGICSSLDSQPSELKQMGFGHSFGTVKESKVLPLQSTDGDFPHGKSGQQS